MGSALKSADLTIDLYQLSSSLFHRETTFGGQLNAISASNAEAKVIKGFVGTIGIGLPIVSLHHNKNY